jgi:hypothetical protein
LGRVRAGSGGLDVAGDELGPFEDEAPRRLRAFRTAGQLTPEELVDRYRLLCRPIRDLLVDYLRQRQPSMDYRSLKGLAY